MVQESHAHYYQNLFTRTAVTAIEREGRWCLVAGETVAHFPVALLAVGEKGRS
jgi:hypothetical protein